MPRGGSRGLPIVAAQMLSQGDKDGDKELSKEEFTALADAWFDKIDPEKAGQLSQERLTARLRDILPTSASSAPSDSAPGAGRGPDGPASISFEVLGPILFKATDRDKDGSLSRTEFEQSFAKWYDDWDTDKAGKLKEESVRKGLELALPRSSSSTRGGTTVTRSRMTVTNETAGTTRSRESRPADSGRTRPDGEPDSKGAPHRNSTGPGSDFSAFSIIVERNIFNSTRRAGRRSAGEEPPPKRVDTLTLVGTLLHDKAAYAFFDGSSSEFRQVLQPGKSIASYTVADISKDGVKLESGTNIVQMRVGMQMRREEDGPWTVVAGSGPPLASSSPSASSSATSSDDDNDIVKRLMKQREQEMK